MVAPLDTKENGEGRGGDDKTLGVSLQNSRQAHRHPLSKKFFKVPSKQGFSS